MRKTADITITTEGRDKGRMYRITEMPASQAEDWAIRAFMAIAHGGMKVPDSVPRSIAGIAILGIKALSSASYVDAKPLLEEMMSCVQVVTSSGVVRKPMEEDIEEIATRMQLRKEIFEVHTGFFALAAASDSTPSKAGKAAASGSRNARTSR